MLASYIDELRAFERWLETNHLPGQSQLLWYKMIALCNRCGWAEWVTVDNRRLMLLADINTEKTLIRVREKLIDAGLIEYQKGKKGCPGKYRLVSIYCKFYSTNDSKSDSICDSKSDSICDSTNVSHIKTKTKTKKIDQDYPINQSNIVNNYDAIDRMDDYVKVRRIVEENIDYDILCKQYDCDRLQEVVEIMTEAICSRRSTIRINGENIPQQAVRGQLLKLTSEHIEYVFDSLDNNSSDVRNIRAYILTTLYNAANTINSYYSAKVNHDLNK